jgi:hypothetical protein
MAAQSTTGTLPVGHIWEIPLRDGKPAEITRPDGAVVVVADGLHALSMPGEFVASVGKVTHKVVATDADTS